MTVPRPDTRWLPDPTAPGWLRAIAEAEGFVMVRQRGGKPFVMSEKEWLELPLSGPEPPPRRSPLRRPAK